jgi:hypothetical protein
MFLIRHLIALAMFCCAGQLVAAPADDIAARLGTRFEQAPVVRAEFVQTKEMAAFKKPLITSPSLTTFPEIC